MKLHSVGFDTDGDHRVGVWAGRVIRLGLGLVGVVGWVSGVGGGDMVAIWG